jgi:hypothetical protein
MTSTLSPTAYSEDLWLTEPAVDPNIRQAGLKGEQPSLGNRVARGLRPFLIIFCMGVGSTLVWQSLRRPGERDDRKVVTAAWLVGAANRRLRGSAPELVPTPPPANSPDLEALKAMSFDLAAPRQSLDEFAASQQQMASHIAKLRAAEQDISDKISSAPPPRPVAAPARKPAPVSAQSLQEPPGRSQSRGVPVI